MTHERDDGWVGLHITSLQRNGGAGRLFWLYIVNGMWLHSPFSLGLCALAFSLLLLHFIL